MKKFVIFLLLILNSYLSISQNLLGSIQENTNAALPSSYEFMEYVFPEPDDEGICSGSINSTAFLDQIFFSQTHRRFIDHPFHFLIGHRPALLQLAITGFGASPDVKVEGFMNGTSLGVKCLNGPSNLPQTINTSIPNFEDYFSVTLPKSWLKIGLTLEIRIGSFTKTLSEEDLKIGPYTELNLVQFDLDILDYNTEEPIHQIIDNFLQEVASAIPASVVRYGKFPKRIYLPEIIANNGSENLVKFTKKTDFSDNNITNTARTGIASAINKNFRRSTNAFLSTHSFGNILNMTGVGLGWYKTLVSFSYDFNFIHELGHTFNLPHWGSVYELQNPNSNQFSYPYGGDPLNYNNNSGNGGGGGESWNFIQHLYEFVSPICEIPRNTGTPGTERSDAMQRGNNCFEVRSYGVGPWDGFGDFSALAMHRFLIGFNEVYSGNVNYRNEEKYFQFRTTRGEPIISLENGKRIYTRDPLQNTSGLNKEEEFPLPGEEKINQNVYLIYGFAHETQTEANLIYKPIRYNGTLPPIIDPTDPDTFNSLKSNPIYSKYFNKPNDITLKITYHNGEILHVLNPHDGYQRKEDFNGIYNNSRKDLDFFSIVVPGDKAIVKVELFNRPFYIGDSNNDKGGNINYYTNINSQNFMDEATFQAEWVSVNVDTDNDSIEDVEDNCPFIANTDQLDSDTDDIGDVCDLDDDNDGVLDSLDNCPLIVNSGQEDYNNNGVGDACGDPPPLYIENISFVIKVYPNPTDNELIVELKNNSKVEKVEFIDFSGKIITPNKVELNNSLIRINVSNIIEGIYLLNITTDKEVNKVKVVIER